MRPLLVSVGVVLAAILVSIGPPFVWKSAADRVEWLPDGGTAFTHGQLIVNLAIAGCVLLFVPGAPAVKWGVLTPVGVGLVLATTPALLVVGGIVQAAWAGVGVERTDTAAEEGADPDNLLWFVSPALLVGPAEELLFRGLVQPLLVDTMGLAAGILGMSVLFGFYHYPNVSDSPRTLDTSDIAELSVSGAGGLVLGGLYVLTGNLLVPILGHSLHVALLFGMVGTGRLGAASESGDEADTDTISA